MPSMPLMLTICAVAMLHGRITLPAMYAPPAPPTCNRRRRKFKGWQRQLRLRRRPR